MRRHSLDLPEALGFDRRQLDAILGDLGEERRERAHIYGRAFALAWWLREILRSAPHLIVDAMRRGSPAERARLAAALGTPILLAALAALLRHGPPARIVTPGGDAIVINALRPVQLSVHVMDERGHALEAKGVRYRWISGMPIGVTPAGITTCERSGDALVRATLGDVVSDLTVSCRPVRELIASSAIDLIAGGAPVDLPFVAIGDARKVVTELRGSMVVADRAVAEVEGTTIRPVGVGATTLRIVVGDKATKIAVIVHQPVDRLDGANAKLDYVALPVRLAQGDTVRWHIPPGAYWVKYLPARAGDSPPTINFDGGINWSSDARPPIQPFPGSRCLPGRRT